MRGKILGKVGTIGFVPERLSEARAARRITSMSALARLLSVSPSTITRWQEGSSTPDSDMLSKLSNTLQVRREYFLRSVVTTDKPMFHRSLSNTYVRDISYQHAQMQWMQEIRGILQHYVDFPPINIPDVLNGASYQQLRDEDIERIALDLRAHWNIGEGPCTDVVALLEREGVIVSTIEMGTSKLDGLCSWSNDEDRPHILLATDKMSFPRRQMDAAHEMAHAVLHRNVTEADLKKDLKFIEKQAFRLASAFLLPSTTYPLEVPRLSLAALLSLKSRWRVSIKAQIHRLADLGIIPEDYKVDLYKLYSAKGWSKEEPLDREWALSEPRLLSDAMNLIVSSGVRTKEDLLAVEFVMSAGDVENITNLPAGWFSEKSAEIVQLKQNRENPTQNSSASGRILPFSLNRTK